MTSVKSIQPSIENFNAHLRGQQAATEQVLGMLKSAEDAEILASIDEEMGKAVSEIEIILDAGGVDTPDHAYQEGVIQGYQVVMLSIHTALQPDQEPFIPAQQSTNERPEVTH